MTTIIILLIIYILSFARVYFWFRNAYNKGGVFEGLNIGILEIVISIVPLLNTMAAIIFTCFTISGKEKDVFNASSFFGIKK